MLIDAGKAGAAGMILVWGAPTDQLAGYWDPHTGTRFSLPAVFLGSDAAGEVTAFVQFDDGTVAFVMAPEHLGTKEILPIPDDPDGRLEFTGEEELFAWPAPEESPALVKASVAAVTRRNLPHTAVLKGVGVPADDQVPSICSQGGLGTPFHQRLIPTIAGISGPWSLWAPAFGDVAPTS